MALQSKLNNMFQCQKNYGTSNEWLTSPEIHFLGPPLFKMSQFFESKTRPALTPYHSYRAQKICSPNQYNIKKQETMKNRTASGHVMA